ncbi:MAG: S9 family peptidase [Rhodothermales bacterium]|nr:S9 family peptidase [Rhodothermales bacterium]
MRFRATTLFLLLVVSTASAQVDEASFVSIDRLFATAEFFPDFTGPMQWDDSGLSYTKVQRSDAVDGAQDIIRYMLADGSEEVIVSAQWLIPEGSDAALRIEAYTWAPDGKRLLIYTNSARVWRRNTRGDYWVLNLETKRLHKLAAFAEPSTTMFAKFAPVGNKVAYVVEKNIYVEDPDSGKIVQLTSDGSDTVVNGTFDWVYEEELSLRDGFQWSPSGKHVAYWQLDMTGVGEFLMINNTDSIYSFVIPVQYPKVGTTNSAARVGVVSADGGATKWMDVPGDPRENYIARMGWAGRDDAIILQQLNRLQNTNTVMIGDIVTGGMKTIYVDRDEAWLEVYSGPDRSAESVTWLDDGNSFTWVTESFGWRHVYVIDRDGSASRLVTKGDFDIASLELIDDENGWIYYIASPDNPTQRYLYRSRLDGSGEAERLTPADQSGWHGYSVAPGAKYAVHRYSSFGTPTITEIVSLPDHNVVTTLVDNARLKKTVAGLSRGEFEFFRVAVEDGTELDGYMMFPPDFDSTKKYPVLFYVYGEPWGQTATDSWGGRNYLWHTMLTQKGYIVASVDNRGTPSLRGRDWRKVVYGQIGILSSADQREAAVAIANRPYVDAERIGVWGWSGGGSMTLNLMFRSPDVYSTGMSVAPVPDQLLYDTIYQERYMGLPDDNAEGYRLGSPITYADQLEGNLLIVHGTGDDNVHYQGAERLINALIAANKQFTMLAYPNRSHGIFEGRNTSRHHFTLMTNYLLDNLPAGPR